MTNEPLLGGEPPSGKPHLNPFTADEIQAILGLVERGASLADAIRRAHHVGLDVSTHAARHEVHQGVARRMLAMYPLDHHPLSE